MAGVHSLSRSQWQSELKSQSPHVSNLAKSDENVEGRNERNDNFESETAAALTIETAPNLTVSGFEHAYALVSSRAFLVDAYHGLAMVPIADA